VDITESGFSSPETTDPDGASALCCLALAMLWLILVAALLKGRLQNHKAEIAQLLPDDLLGFAEINRIIQTLQSARVAPSDATPPAAATSA
jgi:hypothetical protein